MTPLAKIQKEIDRCNQKKGCKAMCSSQGRRDCNLLKRHDTRMEACRKAGLPVEKW